MVIILLAWVSIVIRVVISLQSGQQTPGESILNLHNLVMDEHEKWAEYMVFCLKELDLEHIHCPDNHHELTLVAKVDHGLTFRVAC